MPQDLAPPDPEPHTTVLMMAHVAWCRAVVEKLMERRLINRASAGRMLMDHASAVRGFAAMTPGLDRATDHLANGLEVTAERVAGPPSGGRG